MSYMGSDEDSFKPCPDKTRRAPSIFAQSDPAQELYDTVFDYLSGCAQREDTE